MSYESDYRYRQQTSAGQADQRPMDFPNDGASGKGLLVFAVIIVAFIAFIVLVSVTGSPDGSAPATGDGAVQTSPEAATTEQAVPAQGE